MSHRIVAPVQRPVINLNREMFTEQRQRLARSLAAHYGGAAAAGVVALLRGASDVPKSQGSDAPALFRQESYFYYLFGHEMPDCFGSVDVSSGRSTLFIPRLPESYAVWMGALPQLDKLRDELGIEDVRYVDEIANVFASEKVSRVLVLNGVNTDSGEGPLVADCFVGADKFDLDRSGLLYDTLTEQRVFKTKHEQNLLQEINKISSNAHVAVMTHCEPGLSQHHLESTFLHFCYYEGRCRHVSYTCICATGSDSGILHYIDNDRPVVDGQMALMDMGGEYHCYASDITTCFPINGKFTPEQRAVYELVLKAHDAVFAALRPGVMWADMHKLAFLTMAQGLRDLDLLRATDDEAWDHDLMYTFCPHGLGHLLGLDVHDCGGYTPKTPPRSTKLSLSRLRTARTMEPNIFITIEPGCYFNPLLLEKAFANPDTARFFNEKKLRQSEFWKFGGVRIESNVIVTDTGAVNYTNVPRLVEDIEAVMAGTKKWI